ncbi:unnamed protein product, partial [Allacma fusca]
MSSIYFWRVNSQVAHLGMPIQ